METIAIIIDLISSTPPETGLKVNCTLDTRQYQTGIKVEDEEFPTQGRVDNKNLRHCF